jgi:hypothetical protein
MAVRPFPVADRTTATIVSQVSGSARGIRPRQYQAPLPCFDNSNKSGVHLPDGTFSKAGRHPRYCLTTAIRPYNVMLESRLPFEKPSNGKSRAMDGLMIGAYLIK